MEWQLFWQIIGLMSYAFILVLWGVFAVRNGKK